ncbi:hypothetical protein LCGC14_0624670 [marine sediment metagenome]|uniref:Uncharacterized protein n=1 Tax=marine sediment metagenome TaxID=412755 RepID=A0A0F9RN64_9ZZZZ
MRQDLAVLLNNLWGLFRTRIYGAFIRGKFLCFRHTISQNVFRLSLNDEGMRSNSKFNANLYNFLSTHYQYVRNDRNRSVTPAEVADVEEEFARRSSLRWGHLKDALKKRNVLPGQDTTHD